MATRMRVRNSRGASGQRRAWLAAGAVALTGWWLWPTGESAPASLPSLGADPAPLAAPAPASEPDAAPAARPLDPLASAAQALAVGDLDGTRKACAAVLDSADPTLAARARVLLLEVDLRGGDRDKALVALQSVATESRDAAGADAAVRVAEQTETTDVFAGLRAWTAAWRHPGSGGRRDDIATRARGLAERVLFSAELHEGVPTYTVRAGDSLTRIAEDQGTTIGLLRRANHIQNDRIFAGDRLKIIPGPVSLEVEKSRFRVAVLVGGILVREYQVCVGKENRTPAAEFVVETRLTNPTWYNRGERIPYGDPRNILGTRWLGFRNQKGLPSGLGVHGTSDPASVPGAASMGCVRMRNADVEDLFEMIPIGTRVTIRD